MKWSTKIVRLHKVVTDKSYPKCPYCDMTLNRQLTPYYRCLKCNKMFHAISCERNHGWKEYEIIAEEV